MRHPGQFQPGKDWRGNAAGRPRGILDKRHMKLVIRQSELIPARFEGTPAEFLTAIYQDQSLPLEPRIAAATTLIRAGLGGGAGTSPIVIQVSGADAAL